MKIYLPIKNNQQGMVAIILLFAISAAALALATTMAVLAIGESRMAQSGSASLDQAYYAAEAGLNEALYRLLKDPVPGNYEFEWSGVTTRVTVEADPADPYRRIVKAQATYPDGRERITQVGITTNAYSGGFDSAVNTGDGGLVMENGSCVVGDVISNGPIVGPGAGDNGCKQASETDCRQVYNEKDSIIQKDAAHEGKVMVTGANSISGVSNTGSIRSHHISNSVAGKSAYYATVSGNVKADGGNENCGATSGIYCHAGTPDAPPEDSPINMAVIDAWKAEISVNAPSAYDDCSADSAVYCIDSNDRILGGHKIESDFYIDNGRTLTLNGNLWVTGNISLNNNGTIRIDPSLGGLSVVIIADGMIDVDNNIGLEGTGDDRSFLLMVSTRGLTTGECSDSDPTQRPAICAMNNSDSIIFSAPDGRLVVKNNGCLNAAATYQVHLKQNSTVNFNPNLSAFTVAPTGGNSVEVVSDTWREL